MTTIASDFAPVTFRLGNWLTSLRRLLRRQSLLRLSRLTRQRRVLKRLLADSDERTRRDLGVDLAVVKRHDWLLDLARR